MVLKVLNLRFTKNGGFCKNCVKAAIVKTKLPRFGSFKNCFYLCNRIRSSV